MIQAPQTIFFEKQHPEKLVQQLVGRCFIHLQIGIKFTLSPVLRESFPST